MQIDRLSHVLSSNTLARAKTRLDHWANSIFNVRADKADLRAERFDIAYKSLPFRTMSTTLTQENNTLPQLYEFGSKSLFSLPTTLPINSPDYFAEGDVQLRTRTEDGLPVKVMLTAIYPDFQEKIAEIYTPCGQLDATIRIPLTPLAGKHYGQLARSHHIDHRGCTIELLEIRARSLGRIATTHPKSGQP